MNFNIRLFFKINKLVGKNRFWDAFGRAGAEWVIFAMIAWFVTCVCLVYLPDRTSVLMYTAFLGGAILVSWGVNKIVGLVVKQSRPYVIYPETKVLLDPRPLFSNKTFPSDHTTIAFLIFFIALLLRLPWSWDLLPLAMWVAWGRVYAGVHYPVDIVGGILMAAGIALICKFNVLPILF